MATSAAGPLPTTPPTDYTLTTTGEAGLLTQYGYGGIATQNVASSYSRSAYSHSTPGSDHTVYVDGAGNSSGSASGGVASGWASLSNTTKYAIYGAAGAAALIIILIIVLVVRRSRRKQRKSVEVRTKGLRNSVRMTQRSSFASPMYAMNDNTLRSQMPQSPSQQSDLRGPAPIMERMDSSMSYNSMDKSGGAYMSDNRSVHSVPPIYAGQQQSLEPQQQYYQNHAPQQQQNDNSYPPQRSEARSPPQMQQYYDQQYQGGYSDPQRAMSPTYSQHSSQGGQGYHPQQPQQHFAQRSQQNGHYFHASSQQGYGY